MAYSSAVHWWLVEQLQLAAGSTRAEALVVAEVSAIVQEAIEDVEVAYYVNYSVGAERELELMRLDAEVSRNELAMLRESCVIMASNRRKCETAAYELRQQLITDCLALRSLQQESSLILGCARESRLEADHDILKCELTPCKGKPETAHKREEWMLAQRYREVAGETSNRADVLQKSANQFGRQNCKLLLHDDLMLRTFSFLTAKTVLALAQTNRALFKRVDSLFGVGSSVKVAQPTYATAVQDQQKPQSTRMETMGSLTTKLTAGEIKSIIALGDHARKLEFDCANLKTEKEDLNAALNGSESVNRFLALKLQQAESDLVRQQKTTSDVQSQLRSSHEVINLLDSRNRQLETQFQQCRSLHDLTQSKLREECNDATTKLQQLQQENSKVRSCYREDIQKARKQKKALVNGIKILRLQLAAVQRVVNVTELGRSSQRRNH